MLLDDPARLRALRDASAARLGANTVRVDGRTFAVAAGALYPHQWSWDAAFVAMGLAHLDPLRALDELDALFAAQWKNGKVPHIVYNPLVPAGQYFPDDARWAVVAKAGARGPAPGAPATSGICQPPVHALAAEEILAVAPDRADVVARLRALFPKLVAWHRYLVEERDPERSGLVTIVHPWESGTDNSVRWDDVLARIDPVGVPPYERADLKHAKAAMRPSQLDYDRYLFLVERMKDAGYDDARLLGPGTTYPFRVKDALMSAILVRAHEALRRVADVVAADDGTKGALDAWIARGRAGVASTWDAELSAGLDVDVATGAPIRVRTIAGFAPLVAGDRARRDAQLALLSSDAFCGHPSFVRRLPPSTSPLDPRFDPQRYWRGPSWPIMNWIVHRALVGVGADDAARAHLEESLRQIEERGPAEYFDPRTDEPLGSKVQTWTDAFVVAETSARLTTIAAA